MKLQGMAILYIIIIIPMLIAISLTLSGYREQLHNTLKYDSELTGAVNDAITAFELNSASQDYTNISDNFASLVEASVNIFTRSIATRLNMTNADEALMNRYFPLALFTGYNGYYIYSPTYSPIVVKNPYTGQAAFSSDTNPQTPLDKDSANYIPEEDRQSLQYTPVLFKHKDHNNAFPDNIRVTTRKDFINNVLAKEEIDYSLKQMIPYTLELKKDDNNKILLNFTLDNFISFTGKVKGIAYNKSGFLLNNRTSINLTQGSNTVLYDVNRLNENLPISHLTYFDEYIDYYIENELTKGSQLLTLTVKEEGQDAVSIVFNPTEYRSGYQKYLNDNKQQMTGQYAYQKQQLDAIKYYIKAANFSNFIYNNLNTYTENDIQDINLSGSNVQYIKYFLSYSDSNASIFPTDSNILNFDSTFNEVKRKAIRNSVQYDLIVATLNYNYLVSSSEFLLKLPVITDKDWDRIVENISFTAFLQGLSIGGGNKYNNYSVTTSTMNEFVINPDTIYFSDITGFNQGDLANLEDSELYFHKIDCPDFLEYLTNKAVPGDDISTGAIGFKMSEWLYDAKWSREEAKYIFDHKNYSHFKCIANYTVKTNLDNNEKTIINKNMMSAVAAEKERSFKPNKIMEGGGYKSFGSTITSSGLNIKNLKGFELASEDIDKDNKEFLLIINAGGMSATFSMSKQTNNFLAYPSYNTEVGGGKYIKYKSFIEGLINVFGEDIRWNQINNINIEVENLETSGLESLTYIKLKYI